MSGIFVLLVTICSVPDPSLPIFNDCEVKLSAQPSAKVCAEKAAKINDAPEWGAKHFFTETYTQGTKVVVGEAQCVVDKRPNPK